MTMATQRMRQVDWLSAVVGGVLGALLTVVFALLVVDPVTRWLAASGRTVTVGVMILLLALLRLVAGMWTAQLARRRYEVRYRREFLPTALGTSNDLPRLLHDVLQWLAEFGLGAYLVRPEAPGVDSRHRGRHSARP